MTYAITDCLPGHIAAIRDRLRLGDMREITCLGISVQRALWRSYRAGLMTKAAIVDGRVAAVWGCGGSPLGAVGTPWLLTAPEIERIPVSFVREARATVAGMAEIFPRLENYVAAEYAKACRFLEVLGFTLDDVRPLGPHGAPFRRFWMER